MTEPDSGASVAEGAEGAERAEVAEVAEAAEVAEGPQPPSPRRTTFLVASALLLGCVLTATVLPAPYSVEAPGPTENTLGSYGTTPVLRIEGARTYPTSGQLRLTTVNYTSCGTNLTVWGALQGWLDVQRDVVPRRLVCPTGASPEQVEQQNAEEMTRSQESAKVAALRQVGVTVPEAVVVQAVQKDAPALGRLRAGDRLRTVDGTPVTTPAQVGRLVRSHRPGDVLVFGVERGGRQVTERVRTESRTIEGKTVTAVGIVPAVGYDFPFSVEVTLGEQIGGPSAGLMFSLGIVDKLTPGQLTNGRDIAGTGEIDAAGGVGPIGGIVQKVYGAEQAGATVFLAPAGNCADLAGMSTSMQVVRVETLAGAVGALESLSRGEGGQPSCSGPSG